MGKLLPLLLLVMTAGVNAQDFTWTTNNGAITITRFNGSNLDVTIPATINGMPVTSIGNSAFLSSWLHLINLTNVTVPESVTSIGDSAFKNCGQMSSVSMFDSVTNIGNYAFSGCSNLTGITIPSSLTSIGYQTFSHCGLTNVTIPDGVTNIGDYAFFVCAGLTSVTIRDNVSTIGWGSFDSCGLTNVTFGSGVKSIGPGAFYSTRLTSVTIPNTVGNIGSEAFGWCWKLTSITIPNSVTNMGGAVLRWCPSLTSVTLPNSITNIPIWTFCHCSSLTNVTIPESITSIGFGAFDLCTSLTGVYFRGNAPTIIDPTAFSSGVAATVYYLPGTTGWESTFGDLPTAPWHLPNPLILKNNYNFGGKTNGIGFTISWATNVSIVIEACTNLVNSVWLPVQTNTLTEGSSYFSDSNWTNYPARFYRIRSP